MKSFRYLLVLVVALIAGCGDGGIQSPDFTGELVSLTLSANDADTFPPDPSNPLGPRRVPIGRLVPLIAMAGFTTPPGSDPAIETRVVEDASFTVTPANLAVVEGGVLRGTAMGTVSVTASKGGIESAPLSFSVVAAVLDTLSIAPASVDISINETASFAATGTFTDASTRPIVVTWTVAPPGQVSVSPGIGQQTTATPAVDAGGTTTTLTATATSEDGNEITGTATININNEFLVGLVGVVPTAQTVAPGASAEFTARGTFSDNTTERVGDVPDSLVNWTSADPAVATIGIDTGIATGVTPGQQTTVTATLKPAVTTAPGAMRTATGTITVSDARCTTPLLASEGATAAAQITGVCLLCNVMNADDAIDGDIDTSATINVPVGLANGAASLLVDAEDAPPTTFPAGQRVGFVVAAPPGLLSLELLASLSVGTRLDGEAVEDAGATSVIPLRVSLLGLLGGQDAALISFATTIPYDGLSVTFTAGVASLLPSINVFQACATAVDTTPPPAP
ncbi:MAG: Ig-like domain-containing protein [Panacagrimonas sp.]